VYARVDERVDGHVDGRVSVAMTPFVDEQHRLADYLPIVLNNISSQNAVQRDAKRTEIYLREEHALLVERLVNVEHRLLEMTERNEFVRRELLYELRFRGTRGRDDEGSTRPQDPGTGTGTTDAPKRPTYPVEGPIRLNLGAGHKPEPGYLNVDERALDGIDVIAGVDDLPFDPDTVAEIRSAHMLEHFAEEHLRRALLPYWVSLLAPGGAFVAVVPDALTMMSEFGAGRVPFDDLRRVMYGDQEYEGDYHFTMFSPESLSALFEEAGLGNVEVVETGRRNGLCFEMELRAVRPAADHS
jgi:hypothetical protein